MEEIASVAILNAEDIVLEMGISVRQVSANGPHVQVAPCVHDPLLIVDDAVVGLRACSARRLRSARLDG